MKLLVELIIVLSLCPVECRPLTAETRLLSPVRISLFYESRCPDCRHFVVTQLCPTWVRVKEILNIMLIPFGNAEEILEGRSWQFRCQHGENECQGNIIQSCVMHYLQNATSYMPVICCMESASSALTEAQLCLQTHAPAVLWDTISDCVNGDQGNELMHQNAQMTNELEPPHNYVPWILINGEHSEDLQHQAETDLFNLVCKTYIGREVCDLREDFAK
ncbi:gamma-interferon-inducible lysosomal thiol reductase-like isoform X1 [Scyliorhinus canicula]|uniref:gamma-interferon-inducible lysosomal thiol reductase-like isoform X1 n=1 Tax=Scyliorhinus canicula TaxID=7830 RepID=UPI0018F76661|nr:gamma-interferon-inducible lysosomal thiol reductase-like isoform X1 [Scyliorhinus canicula]